MFMGLGTLRTLANKAPLNWIDIRHELNLTMLLHIHVMVI